jgi:hypothetical protein
MVTCTKTNRIIPIVCHNFPRSQGKCSKDTVADMITKSTSCLAAQGPKTSITLTTITGTEANRINPTFAILSKEPREVQLWPLCFAQGAKVSTYLATIAGNFAYFYVYLNC